MLLVEYPKCTTCQKAKKWLDENDELKAWHAKSGLPLRSFFNTSGLLYKSMQLKEKLPLMSEEEQLRLLATDGMLVKRPIVVDGDTILVGFKSQQWERLK